MTKLVEGRQAGYRFPYPESDLIDDTFVLQVLLLRYGI